MTTEKEESTAKSSATPDLSLNTILELLANQRRRFALYTLVDTPTEVVDFQALVEDVATLEAAHAGAAFTRDHYLDVASDLYHWHLPVLNDVGLIDTDSRSGSIRYWSHSHPETWTARVKHDEFLM